MPCGHGVGPAGSGNSTSEPFGESRPMFPLFRSEIQMAPDGSVVSQPARGSADGMGVVARLSWLSNEPMFVLRLTYSPWARP